VIRQSGFEVIAQADVKGEGRPCRILTVYPARIAADLPSINGEFAIEFTSNVIVREVRDGCFEVMVDDPTASTQTERAPEMFAILDRMQARLKSAIEDL
jgi:hypothetical protein